MSWISTLGYLLTLLAPTQDDVERSAVAPDPASLEEILEPLDDSVQALAMVLSQLADRPDGREGYDAIAALAEDESFWSKQRHVVLCRLMREESAWVREHAALLISQAPHTPRATVRALMQTLGDSSDAVVLASLQTLEGAATLSRCHPSYAEALIPLLDHAHTEVRWGALTLLGDLDRLDAQGIAALAHRIRDPDGWCRYLVLEALTQHVEVARRYLRMQDIFRMALEDDERAVREMGIRALWGASEQDPELLHAIRTSMMGMLDDDLGVLFSDLARFGPRMIPILDDCLAALRAKGADIPSPLLEQRVTLSPDPSAIDALVVRVIEDIKRQSGGCAYMPPSGAAVLASLGQPVLEHLGPMLGHRESIVRRGAVGILERVKPRDPQVLEAMMSVFEDSDAGVQLRVHDALRKWGPDAASVRWILWERRDQWTLSACLATIRSMGRSASDMTLPLTEFLKGELTRSETQESTIVLLLRTLASIGAEHAVAALEELIFEEFLREDIRATAFSSLASIPHHPRDSTLETILRDPESSDELLECALNCLIDNRELTERLMDRLMVLAEDRGELSEPLMKVFESHPAVAAQVLPSLLESSTFWSFHLLEAVRVTTPRNDELMAMLAAGMVDEDGDLDLCAVDALAAYGDLAKVYAEAVADLVEAYQETDDHVDLWDAWVLLSPDRAYPWAFERWRHDPELTEVMVHSLKSLPFEPDRTTDVLIEVFASSPDAYQRGEAAWALSRMGPSAKKAASLIWRAVQDGALEWETGCLVLLDMASRPEDIPSLSSLRRVAQRDGDEIGVMMIDFIEILSRRVEEFESPFLALCHERPEAALSMIHRSGESSTFRKAFESLAPRLSSQSLRRAIQNL